MSIAFPCLSDLLSSLPTPNPPPSSSPPPPPPPPQNLLPPSNSPSVWSPLVTGLKSRSRFLEPSSLEARVVNVTRVAFPSLAYSNPMFFKSEYFNVQVNVEDDEPEERLVNRFRRAVVRAGVLRECRRRRFFESSQEKRKRKAREASKKNRKRRSQPKAPPQNKQETSKNRKDNDEGGDNWEIPNVEIPYTDNL